MSAAAIRLARVDDLPVLQAIRQAAFAPIFASFRAMLGDALYEIVQAYQKAGFAAQILSVWMCRTLDAHNDA